MPRPLRIHAPGAFYHVTLRGNHRQNIFFTPDDRRLFEDITADVVERFTARLHAFCWMSNHVRRRNRDEIGTPTKYPQISR